MGFCTKKMLSELSSGPAVPGIKVRHRVSEAGPQECGGFDSGHMPGAHHSCSIAPPPQLVREEKIQ